MSGRLLLLPTLISETPVTDVLPEKALALARSTRRFLAENAKSARAFLKAIGHPGPIAELEIIEIGHEPDPDRFEPWLEPVLTGIDTAIVSEAGCPAVADPGAGIVRVAHSKGIQVLPLVGPSAILMTVMASGLNGQRFRFWGYLPQDREELARAIIHLERESRHSESELFIETPYRNNRMLEALTESLSGDTLVCVATDISGEFESVRTLPARDWKPLLGKLPKSPTVFAIMANGTTTTHSRPPRTAKRHN